MAEEIAETFPLDGKISENDTPAEELEEVIKHDLSYGLEDNPPWYMCILLSIQQILTCFGGALSNAFLVASLLCVAEDNSVRATILATSIFITGIVTILQTMIGIRLPIVQGASSSFVVPIIAILQTNFSPCSNFNLSNMTIDEQQQEFLIRMREIQGCTAVASIFQLLIGLTGVIGLCITFISPLVVATTLSLMGIAMAGIAAEIASSDWWISTMTILLLVMSSQVFSEVKFPFPKYSKSKGFTLSKFPLFKSSSVLLSMAISWSICAILTQAKVFPLASPSRTDRQLFIVYDSPWFHFPSPLQWGLPTISVGGVFGILSGVVVSVIESIGDYYACARLTGSPPPPRHAINRGIFIEGIGCLLSGIWGTGTATTSYSENVSAIRITRVGSRRVTEVAGVIMVLIGMSGKVCSIFLTIPQPVIGGVFFVLASMIVAVGISNLQMVNLRSSRNIFILGFSIFLGISIPSWTKNNPNFTQSGSLNFDQLVRVLLSTPMAVGGFAAVVLDNSMSGKEKDTSKDLNSIRGGSERDSRIESSYDLPFGMVFIKSCRCLACIPISPTFSKWSRKK